MWYRSIRDRLQAIRSRAWAFASSMGI